MNDDDMVVTAGAYVRSGNLYPFMIGPTSAGDQLAIVRLGGHRETGESAWQCAAREVREEASLTISPLRPPTTYWLGEGEDPSCIRAGTWQCAERDAVPPILVVRKQNTSRERLSVMFLARAITQPHPASETRGLVLLRPNDVATIVTGDVTLGGYLANGGQAIIREPLNVDLPLEPFLQIRVFAYLLDRHPTMFALPVFPS
jgi:hypothetical protein